MNIREQIKNKNRIVIKIGSSSLTHAETGRLNLKKLDQLVRTIADIKNQGKQVVLVSSGAIAVGSKAVGLEKKPISLPKKQACASVGQAILMMIYQKLFREYNRMAAQILLTKDIMEDETRRQNTINTFNELLEMDVIPIVNENDTVSTEEIEFGDNDTLSAIVASLIEADLLILLSDIDGLYTDDPRENKEAILIEVVRNIDDNLLNMAKGAGSDVGTGGMITKLTAAQISTESGADMIITNANDINNIHKILQGENIGTLFVAKKNK